MKRRQFPQKKAVFLAFILFLGVAAVGHSQTKEQAKQAEADARALLEFSGATGKYVQLHHKSEADLPRAEVSASADDILRRQHLLAEKIRVARGAVKEGNIFSPNVRAYFERAIKAAYHAHPEGIQGCLAYNPPTPDRVLQPNESYPEDLPYNIVPPTILLHLPKLPPELEYGFFCGDLILRDKEANLIVDVMRKAIPVTRRGSQCDETSLAHS